MLFRNGIVFYVFSVLNLNSTVKIAYHFKFNRSVILLRTNPRLVKRSDRFLDFIFNTSSIFNNATIIYEQVQLPNAFQILNLNKDIAAMMITFTRTFSSSHSFVKYRRKCYLRVTLSTTNIEIDLPSKLFSPSEAVRSSKCLFSVHLNSENPNLNQEIEAALTSLSDPITGEPLTRYDNFDLSTKNEKKVLQLTTLYLVIFLNKFVCGQHIAFK